MVLVKMSEASRLVHDTEHTEAEHQSGENLSRSVSPPISVCDVVSTRAPEKAREYTVEEQPDDKHGKHSSLLRDWWKEILIFSLGTAALLAIFVLLMWSHGMLLRDWHSKVSINTTIAVLAQVTASALLYIVSNSMSQLKWVLFQRKARALVSLEHVDMASRGPSGAIMYVLGKADYS